MKGLNLRDKGLIITALIRSIFAYGLVARGVNDSEIHIIWIEENKMLRSVNQTPKWRMKLLGVNMSDLYLKYDLVAFWVYVGYAKATFFGHTMRRDSCSLIKQAFTGKLQPPLVRKTEDIIG